MIAHTQSILEEHKDDLAFIIGNGINLYYKNEGISWNDLLLELWEEKSLETTNQIPEGISFTEFYDALEIQNAAITNFSSSLQKAVKTKMEDWQFNPAQNRILKAIKDKDAPLLTTNFDDLIPRSLDLQFFKNKTHSFTDYYPWSRYYGDKELKDPAKGFGVWFPNGMMKYQRSIKLGLSQYMGNVERARELIHQLPGYYDAQGKSPKNWAGAHTWLQIIFNRSLMIFGLGLNENEIFLRWLLIERAKYFRRFPQHTHKGWYLAEKSDDLSHVGRNFFLNSVGIEVITFDSYQQIYEDVWG